MVVVCLVVVGNAVCPSLLSNVSQDARIESLGDKVEGVAMGEKCLAEGKGSPNPGPCPTLLAQKQS